MLHLTRDKNTRTRPLDIAVIAKVSMMLGMKMIRNSMMVDEDGVTFILSYTRSLTAHHLNCVTGHPTSGPWLAQLFLVPCLLADQGERAQLGASNSLNLNKKNPATALHRLLLSIHNITDYRK